MNFMMMPNNMAKGEFIVFIVALIVLLAALLFRLRRQIRAAARSKHVSNSFVMTHATTRNLLKSPVEKIYLFAFPPVPLVHNISPFTLKLESFLRMSNIPYEFVPTFQFSSKGQMPYIRLNSRQDGVEIPDSNVIVNFLKKKYGIDEKEQQCLSAEQRAVAHAVTRMVEVHTTQIGFYYRYGLHIQEFNDVIIPKDWFTSGSESKGSLKTWLVGKAWTTIMAHAFRKKNNTYGRHSDEEKWQFSFDDLQAISHYLGDKKYFFGDEATTVDSTLFGHLAQFLYIPLDNFPQQQFIHEHCPNLVAYVDRFKKQYFHDDWD